MVEENEFRSTYKAVNERRCVFEKTILSRHCSCLCSTRFFLADREGIHCESEQAQQRCTELLAMMRDRARFALKLKTVAEALPHTSEIKVQSGGMLGLQRCLHPELRSRTEVDDIAGLIASGIKAYGSLTDFPFQEITRSIADYEGRKRRSRSDH